RLVPTLHHGAVAPDQLGVAFAQPRDRRAQRRAERVLVLDAESGRLLGFEAVDDGAPDEHRELAAARVRARRREGRRVLVQAVADAEQYFARVDAVLGLDAVEADFVKQAALGAPGGAQAVEQAVAVVIGMAATALRHRGIEVAVGPDA